MPVIHADPRPFVWQGKQPGQGGSFRPNGKLIHVLVGNTQAIPNPNAFETAGNKVLAARLFVGFNVGGKPTWKLPDLVKIVAAVRLKQKRDPDASFIAQKGIFTSHLTGTTIVEDGAQIILINLHNDPLPKFRAQMEHLAEVIAKKLKQELIILELQRAGITLRTIGVQP